MNINKSILVIFVAIVGASCVPKQEETSSADSFVNKNVQRRIASETARSVFNALTAPISTRMGDREYVHNVFVDVFGPSADTLTRPYIMNNGAALNGGCSQYEATYSDMNGGTPVAVNANFIIDDPKANCSLSNINLGVVGSENSIREGLRLQACEVVVNNATALFYVIDSVTGVTNVQGSFSTLPTPIHIKAIYNKFYPAQDINEQVLQSLVAIGNSTALTTAKDKFKLITLAICMSADWQIP